MTDGCRRGKKEKGKETRIKRKKGKQGDERASREAEGQGRRVKNEGKSARTYEDKKGHKGKSRQTVVRK